MKHASKSWAEKIAGAICEAGTFDLDLDVNEYPTIHWVIAHWLLRDATEYGRVRRIEGYAQKIQNAFSTAMALLDSRGVRIYRVIPEGTNKIHVVTTDPKYKSDVGNKTAKIGDVERIRNRITKNIQTTLKQVEAKHPERLERLKGQLLLTFQAR